MINVSPTTLDDAVWLGRHLRDEDRDEVWASTGRDPTDVLIGSLEISRDCLTVRYHDTICAIFGATEDGVAWMLCSEEAPKRARQILRGAPGWVDRLSARHPHGLQCLAWANNYLHVRWCKHLGFVELRRVIHRGHEFIHLHRHIRTKCVNPLP